MSKLSACTGMESTSSTGQARDDINWYGDDQIVCLMPESLPMNKRSVQIDHSMWKYLEEHLNV